MNVWIAFVIAFFVASTAVQALSAEHKLQLAFGVAKWSALVWIGARACALAYGMAAA
jgi:hypothetical protein